MTHDEMLRLIQAGFETQRDWAFGELESRGVSRAVVEFSGGNDEGGVDRIRLDDVPLTASPYDLYVSYDYKTNTHSVSGKGIETISTDSLLAYVLSYPVDVEYGSFAGEYSVDGTVEWDVALKDVHMRGEQMHESWYGLDQEW